MLKNFIIISTIATTLFSCATDDKKRADTLNELKKDAKYLTNIEWIDTAFDLGTINGGDVKEMKFKFKNTGSQPLFLGNVTAGCGCTVPSFSKDEIKPGAEGFVSASFDSKKQCGQLEKFINVPSNASNDSLRVLKFKVNVINCQSNDIVVPKAATKDDPSEIKGTSEKSSNQ